jgi:hypothetical protein
VGGLLEIWLVLGVMLALYWLFVLEVLAPIESDQVELHWERLAGELFSLREQLADEL